MFGVAAWWQHLTTLSGQTMRVWWTVLPKVLIAWVCGWLVYQVALVGTAPIQEEHPWLAIILFSVGLVAQLAGIIIGIRLAGEPAGLWDTVPASVARIGRDEPLLRVLSVSLLPFVGVYSVFGGIEQATYSMFVYGALESSAILNPQTATTILDPQTSRQRLVIAGVLVLAYLLRRGLEATADRTGRALFGLLGALVEGFFSVVLIFGGSRMLGDLGDWVRGRAFYGWLLELGGRVADWLASWHIAIPDFIGAAWRLLTTDVWPLVLDGVLAPLLWLAVAGLVFGTYTLSVAELWERGAAGVRARQDGSAFARRISALQQRGLNASTGSRKVTLEFFDVFVGDLEDRIIPFIQSARHVLRAGLPFVGAFVLLYAITQAIGPAMFGLAHAVIGGQHFQVWLGLNPLIELLGGVLGEPIRLSLLAVAMTLTLAANREHDDDLAAVAGGAPGAVRASVPAGEGRRTRRTLPTLLLTLACLLAAGAITAATSTDADEDHIPVAPGQWHDVLPGQGVRVGGLQSGPAVLLDGNPDPALVSNDLFVAVDIQLRSSAASSGSITCAMVVPGPDGDPIESEAVLADHVPAPQIGFGITQTLVFERPADGVAGAAVHCKPYSFFLSYEPVLVLDLGIDQQRQTELAASGSPVEVVQFPAEVVLP